MSDSVKHYNSWLSALNRAKELDYSISVFSDSVKITHPRNKSPEFAFFEPSELHCYLNGLQDGKE